jgi:CheY-like chemotaxis protein
LSEEASRNATRQIQFAADRAAGLTRQLLTFSRRQVIQRRDLDLNSAVTNITQFLANLLGEHIELETNLTPGLPPIHADPGMIEQVIMNLAVNARDAMPRGGRISLRTELNETDTAFLTRRTGARRGRFVVLAVSDNGTGIGSEHLPRIFDPFFTTKEVGKGTGLGLATVYGIAKQHDGWVDVESLAGEGTTFRVYFPAVDSPAADTAPVAVEHPRGGGERILLVEDEPMLRSMAEQILHLNGYTVTSAADGPEARQFWRERDEDFHLLVTDMVMPRGLTGGELAAELRRECEDLKVVLMSGYSREIVDPDASLVAGTRFLQKPYLPDELLRAVRAALDGVTR